MFHYAGRSVSVMRVNVNFYTCNKQNWKNPQYSSQPKLKTPNIFYFSTDGWRANSVITPCSFHFIATVFFCSFILFSGNGSSKTLMQCND